MTLFKIEDQLFGWDEIVVAAQVWGEWGKFVESVRQSLACLGLATKTGQLPSPAKMREVVTDFRYGHNLISAEETHAWLKHWEMTLEDWMCCLRAQLLRRLWSAQLTEVTAANPISDDEVSEVIKAHAICTGKLLEWANKLAGRAALAIGALSRAQTPDEQIARIEDEFERTVRQTITPKLIENKIVDHRLDWTYFECYYLWFADEVVAREAAWCVNEDGLTLEEVASEAHTEARKWNFYADEIDVIVRPSFLAARKGDLLGPLRFASGYPLFSVLDKRMPAANDPQILTRAEQTIVASLTTQALNDRVKWICA